MSTAFGVQLNGRRCLRRLPARAKSMQFPCKLGHVSQRNHTQARTRARVGMPEPTLSCSLCHTLLVSEECAACRSHLRDNKRGTRAYAPATDVWAYGERELGESLQWREPCCANHRLTHRLPVFSPWVIVVAGFCSNNFWAPQQHLLPCALERAHSGWSLAAMAFKAQALFAPKGIGRLSQAVIGWYLRIHVGQVRLVLE